LLDKIFNLFSNTGIVRSRTLILFFLVTFSFTSFGQVDNYRTGVLIDSIQVGNSSETYALYLPKSYDENVLTSIVFIFEPVGRGKVGIGPFIESAERYNHILVCSNNSRNGPYDLNFQIANRLFESIFSSFNIDEKQIYISGFSGGSRLASAIAVLSDQMQGVIACGAGFSVDTSHKPFSKESFSYIGLVGERDMNYYEMFDVKAWLDKFQIENEIITYDDDHRWPPSNQILKAFDLLEMKAYKRKIRKLDHINANRIYNKIFISGRQFEDDNQMLKAVFEYERLDRNFRTIYNTDSISKKINLLRNTELYEQELKVHLSLKEKESEIKSIYVNRFKKEINSKKIPNEHRWWTKKFKAISEDLKTEKDVFYQNMLKRTQYGIYAMIIETSYSELRRNETKRALYCHELLTIMLPDNPQNYFNLARDHARLRNKEDFLINLEMAILKGFKDKQLIKNTTDFYKYFELEEFKTLFNQL